MRIVGRFVAVMVVLAGVSASAHGARTLNFLEFFEPLGERFVLRPARVELHPATRVLVVADVVRGPYAEIPYDQITRIVLKRVRYVSYAGAVGAGPTSHGLVHSVVLEFDNVEAFPQGVVYLRPDRRVYRDRYYQFIRAIASATGAEAAEEIIER